MKLRGARSPAREFHLTRDFAAVRRQCINAETTAEPKSIDQRRRNNFGR